MKQKNIYQIKIQLGKKNVPFKSVNLNCIRKNLGIKTIPKPDDESENKPNPLPIKSQYHNLDLINYEKLMQQYRSIPENSLSCSVGSQAESLGMIDDSDLQYGFIKEYIKPLSDGINLYSTYLQIDEEFLKSSFPSSQSQPSQSTPSGPPVPETDPVIHSEESIISKIKLLNKSLPFTAQKILSKAKETNSRPAKTSKKVDSIPKNPKIAQTADKSETMSGAETKKKTPLIDSSNYKRKLSELTYEASVHREAFKFSFDVESRRGNLGNNNRDLDCTLVAFDLPNLHQFILEHRNTIEGIFEVFRKDDKESSFQIDEFLLSVFGFDFRCYNTLCRLYQYESDIVWCEEKLAGRRRKLVEEIRNFKVEKDVGNKVKERFKNVIICQFKIDRIRKRAMMIFGNKAGDLKSKGKTHVAKEIRKALEDANIGKNDEVYKKISKELGEWSMRFIEDFF